MGTYWAGWILVLKKSFERSVYQVYMKIYLMLTCFIVLSDWRKATQFSQFLKPVNHLLPHLLLFHLSHGFIQSHSEHRQQRRIECHLYSESAGLAASQGRQIDLTWRNSAVLIAGTLWMTLQGWEVEGNAAHLKRHCLHLAETMVPLSEEGRHSRTSAARRGKDKFWMGVSHPVDF